MDLSCSHTSVAAAGPLYSAACVGLTFCGGGFKKEATVPVLLLPPNP